MKEFKKELVNISDLDIGDTVILDGKAVTVTFQNLKTDVFFGLTLYGNNYRGGLDKITRILYPKFYKGELVGYFRQI